MLNLPDTFLFPLYILLPSVAISSRPLSLTVPFRWFEPTLFLNVHNPTQKTSTFPPTATTSPIFNLLQQHPHPSPPYTYSVPSFEGAQRNSHDRFHQLHPPRPIPLCGQLAASLHSKPKSTKLNQAGCPPEPSDGGARRPIHPRRPFEGRHESRLSMDCVSREV